jgi:4-carboxymuconolactone decarboxylase
MRQDVRVPRILPLPLAEWDPELVSGSMLTASDGDPLNIFATIAHHPKALKRWLVFATHVLSKSTLSARDRELLILRTGRRCDSDYEWGQHVLIARECGITDAEIAAVAAGPDDPSWGTHDAALLRAADELHDNACLGDATWLTLTETYSTQQMIDVLFTVGNYHTVAFVLNSAGTEREAGVPGRSW